MTVVFFGVLLVAINLCAVLNVFYWQFGKKERIRRVILPSVMLEPSLPQQPEPGSEVVISCAANNIFGQYKCQQEQKTLIYVVTPTYPRCIVLHNAYLLHIFYILTYHCFSVGWYGWQVIFPIDLKKFYCLITYHRKKHI